MPSRAFQRFREMRVAQGKQRPLPKLGQKQPEPQPAKPDRGGDIEPVNREALRLELGRDEEEQVDDAHDEDAEGDRHQPASAALQIAGQEQRERQREMEDYEEECDDAPSSPRSRDVVRNLLDEV